METTPRDMKIGETGTASGDANGAALYGEKHPAMDLKWLLQHKKPNNREFFI